MTKFTPAKNNDDIKTTQQHELDIKKAEMGVIGRVLGSGDGIAKNVAALVIITLTVLIVFAFAFKPVSEAQELAKTVIPVLTLAIGYMFGKK